MYSIAIHTVLLIMFCEYLCEYSYICVYIRIFVYTSVYLQLHNTVHCDTPRDRFLHCYSRREPTSTQEEEKKKKKGILTQATDQHPKKKIKKNVARIANSVQVTTTNPQCHHLSFSFFVRDSQLCH